jgi:subtilisin family serine protease
MRALVFALLALPLFSSRAAAEPARQVVVQLASPAAPEPARASDRRAAALARVAARLASLDLAIVRVLDDGLAPAGAARGPAAPAHRPQGFDPERIVLLEAPDTAAAARAIAALGDDLAFDWAEPNRTRRVQLWSLEPATAALARAPFAHLALDSLASDPMLRSGDQYGLLNPGPSGPYGGRLRADVHALEGWRLGVGANDVTLAVADTGVDPAHPELGGLLPDGRARITDALNATLEPGGAVTDSFGHGTPVAGVALARTNNGAPLAAGRGVAGVCGGDGGGNAGCRYVPIKISPGHSGEATSFDVARAILHATRVGARAMNLSYASDEPSRVEREAMLWSLVHGCVVVAASGNQGFNDPTRPQYPAAFAADGFCLQVGASDWNDERAVFSSYGPGLDLLAPGFVVWTTFMTYPSYFGAAYDGYVQASGTSFAAPFGTGAVGLLAAARPELRDVDFQRILRESADDLGAPGPDAPTGYGRLNLGRALEAVAPEIGIWHDEAEAAVTATGPAGTLHVGERFSVGLDRWRGDLPAERLEVRATVALPDSFLGPYRVWPRVGGTMAVRGDFRLPYWAPWAEVIEQGEREFTLRGWLYRLTGCGGCLDDVLPLPADQARFGFTVLGRADRAPRFAAAGLDAAVPRAASAAVAPGDTLALSWSATDADTVTRVRVEFASAAGRVALASVAGASGVARVPAPCAGAGGAQGELRFVALDERGHRDSAEVAVPLSIAPATCGGGASARFAAGPSPFAGALLVWAPEPGDVRVFDAGGRLVRRLGDGSGRFDWDGRDANGRDAPAGLYLVRWRGASGGRTVRVVKLR